MEYIAPSNLSDALNRLASDKCRVVAGGTDFYPSLQAGANTTSILDVSRVPEMLGIARSGDGWRIGAAVCWSDITRAELPPAFCGLKAAACRVGGLQVQNAGTVAGNLCNASPAADGVPPLLTLGAEVELRSVRGSRYIPLDLFISGVRKTELAEDELVTAIFMPDPPSHAVGAFEKLGSRSYLVISIVMTACVIGLDESGRIDYARIALGACSPVACRLKELEADILGQTLDQVEVTQAHISRLNPISDVRASADYRLKAAVIQCQRAILGAGGA